VRVALFTVVSLALLLLQHPRPGAGADCGVGGSAVDSQTTARWNRYAARLERLNGSGTNKPLARELLRMADASSRAQRAVAQSMGRPGTAKGGGNSPQLERMLAVNRANDAELKQIVREHGWPTVHLVGLAAASAALGILNESEDTPFEAALLPALQRLAKRDAIPRPTVAGIQDTVLVAGGKKQLYGTILTVRNGRPVMLPVQDPAHLEQRRDQYLLERNYVQNMAAELKAAQAPCAQHSPRARVSTH